MDKLFIVDASGYLYRSYFAISSMTNAKGESTNALFGFIRSLMKLIKDFHPEHCVAVFDGPDNAASRTAIYSDYKAHRSSMPDDLRYQIDWAREFCDLMGIPQLTVPGVEADDAIGSAACWAEQQGSSVFLCTSDKDLYQFVNDRIKILNTFKENLILGPKEVEENFGVSPSQMVDFLAITGDASDNVPGLPGFGPKTAASLLKQYGSLEEILKQAHAMEGKKREILLHDGPKAVLSKKLVMIDTSLDVPRDTAFYHLKPPALAPLKEMYARMNFNTLLRELTVLEQQQAVATSSPESSPVASRVIVDDEASLTAFVEVMQKAKEVCIVVESTPVHPLDAEIIGIAFCMTGYPTWYLPFNGQLARQKGVQELIQGLKPIFESPHIRFSGHHIKQAYQVLLNVGIHIRHLAFDTMLASYILNAHHRNHSLEQLMLEHHGRAKIIASDLQGKGKGAIPMSELPITQVADYCCEAAEYTHRLTAQFMDEIKTRNLGYLFYDIEMPLVPILARMERHGIYLDIPYLHEMSKEVTALLNACEQAIYALAGEQFNINSPKQLSVILFEKMSISPPKKTATGHSTNVDVLDSLKDKYPIAGKLLEYRTLAKMLSTYIDSLPLQVNARTHRIHCSFNQTIAATGRLSSQDPNLQNIPVRSEMGRRIRAAFCPEKPGWCYLSADYSQIELRLLAHLSEDPVLISAFANNEDIHAHTAAAIFHVPLAEVTREQRHQAKAVNFGIIYGQQAFGLSQELGISAKEATAFIDIYFKKFKRVKEFIENCKSEARTSGKAVTLTGRERLIPEINSKNGMLKAAAERLAINTPLQGTAADLIKLAMIRVDHELSKRQQQGYLVLQIHDELLFEIPEHEKSAIDSIVREAMEGVWKLKVPLVVDISVGENWEKC